MSSLVLHRRTVLSWCMYDFGNSAFAILFPTLFGVFYRNQIVGDPGLGDLWWGRTVSASMALVALTSPFLGGIADHAGVRKRMLAAYTGLGLGAVLAFTFLEPGWILAGFVLGALADFAFEGGAVFYNAYLPDIAPPSHQGRVSAWGFATGYVGALVALGVALVLALTGALAWVWVALAVQWGLSSIPAFRYLPPDRPSGRGFVAAAREGGRRTVESIKEAARLPALRWFLLAYFFYMDGVNTVIAFAPVYATGTLKFTESELLGLMALVQVAALLGSLALARATDVRGPRFTIRILLVWWTVVVASAYLATTKPAFLGVAFLAGLGLGGIQAASRTFMARLIPPGREAGMFALYALCGKTGSILGPLIFGSISYAVGQRPAILSVAGLFAIGAVFLAFTAKEAGRVPAPRSAPNPAPSAHDDAEE